MLSTIKNFFLTGEKRSIHAKKSILSLILVRGLTLPISFILIPLTIRYVDSESYGIWLTITSIVAWMNFFDIGINNGLRNKLAESIAKDDRELSKKYVSTTYAILGGISGAIFILFLIANQFMNWSVILNTKTALAGELSKVALIVVGYFCLKFVLSTVNIILLADQQPAKASLRGFIEQLTSLIVIFILTRYTEGSLLNLAYGLCIAPIIVLVLFNADLFLGRYKDIKPSFSSIDLSLTKSLMGIGMKFFIIQIAGVIQFQTANFIIIHYFGAGDVTVYNIVFKYFSVLTILMTIFTTPFWSAVTNAYVLKDYKWIKDSERKYRMVAIGFTLLGVVMLFLSNYAYDLWLGKERIFIPFTISALMLLFTIITFFGGIYCTILNGISALNIQYKASMISPLLFLGTSYVFIKYLGWGVNSIILASIISNFNAFILAPLQYIKIFHSK